MAKRVSVVILCEDLQHEVFLRAVLLHQQFNIRHMRIVRREPGDAKQFVVNHFPAEVQTLRRHRREHRILIVMTDADDRSVNERLKTLTNALATANVDPIKANDPVFCFVPKWEIETWLAYLDGKTVQEDRKYPKLVRESDAQPLVKRLMKMCNDQRLRRGAPPSLAIACDLYRRMVTCFRRAR
jgi:hypothetical protein